MSPSYLEEMFGLTGQTAVVIGGAGVLGGALCAGLAQAGAHVVVADLTEEGCKARVEALEKLGGKASFCTVNVTQRESIENLLADNAQADRPGRYPGQLRRRERRHLVSRRHRRRLGPHPDDQPPGRVPGVPDLRPAHGRRRRRLDRQHRQRHLAPAAVAGVRLCGLEGRRAEPDAQHRPGVRHARACGSTPFAPASSRPSRTASC